MKIGRVEDPGSIDFTLPEDHPETSILLQNLQHPDNLTLDVGCAKWSRQELKNFYPPEAKDDLAWYASRFNAIELNATFYRYFSADQIGEWVEKVPPHFHFFPKVHQEISHRKWLANITTPVERFEKSITRFHQKLGTSFLQLRDNFAPKYLDRVIELVRIWPEDLPLAIELRHRDWFRDPTATEELFRVMQEYGVANVIVDTAGRRDLLHMHLTNDEAFVRFVGSNHPSDYDRLNAWVERLAGWIGQGLRRIHFFVHENEEIDSPVLASWFIYQMNQKAGTDLILPVSLPSA